MTKTEEKLLLEVQAHYSDWNDDNKIRQTRDGGWDAVTDAYWGKLPDDWPFISRTVDPRIRTAVLEKNARLLNAKLRGRVSPREGGDILGARLNNAILDQQWDNANCGGSMLTKLGITDQDTRLYACKFALIPWKYELDDDGDVAFDGNEFEPLDIRDCGMDFACSHIRDAKWFQHRKWTYVEDLEKQSDRFPGLKKLKLSISQSQQGQVRSSQRKNEYISRVKTLKGLEDRVGDDLAFPVQEIVTEYRKNKWITFSPEHNVILRVIPNPYKHGKIPVSQLRYYPLQDDPLGESEVEPVLPLWRAIQATLCGYMDEVILKMRPPLKIMEGQARIETIVYGPEAQWIVSRPDAITEMQSNGEAVRYFQTTYSALVSAFTAAMGGLSQGVSSADPFNADKTATEVRATEKQQNVRDEKNQTDLGEFLKDVMSMWISNNKQFLFDDPDKKEHIIKIIGKEQFAYFMNAGMNEETISNESMQMLADIIQQTEGNMNDQDLMTLMESAKEPVFPVVENPNEKDPEKLIVKSKMKVSDKEDEAELVITPEDLEGNYDYIPDVKSMAVSASDELQKARMQALEGFQNNAIIGLLAQDGYRPKIKELYSSVLEDTGLRDSERYFERIEQGINQAGNQQMGGVGANPQVGGLPGFPQANPGIPGQEQMAGSSPIPFG